MVDCGTRVKTLEAVDQDKQGIRGIGFGQLVTARDAIWTERHTRKPKLCRGVYILKCVYVWCHLYANL